jgi:hypothetical protein
VSWLGGDAAPSEQPTAKKVSRNMPAMVKTNERIGLLSSREGMIYGVKSPQKEIMKLSIATPLRA